eukprot:Sdes_comp17131_c0_seq1m6292
MFLDRDQWSFIISRIKKWLYLVDDNDFLASRAISFQTLLLLDEIAAILETSDHFEIQDGSLKQLWTTFKHDIFRDILHLFLTVAHCDAETLSKLSQHMYLEALSAVLRHVPPPVLEGFQREMGASGGGFYALLFVDHESTQKRAFLLVDALVAAKIISTAFEKGAESERAVEDVEDISDTAMIQTSAATDDSGWQPPSEILNWIRDCEREMSAEGRFPHRNHRDFEACAGNVASYEWAQFDDFSAPERHLRFGYFSCWFLLFDFLKGVPPAHKSRYLLHIKETDMISLLLNILFQHIPLVAAKALLGPIDTCATSLYFESLTLTDQGQSLSRLCSHLFFTVLKYAPALARLWWNGLNRQMYCLVEKYTAAYLSPILIEQEMISVRETKLQDLQALHVKTSLASGTVSALYAIEDDVSIQLTVKLQPNHPLRVVEIDSPRNVGITLAEWRKWKLQLTVLLAAQNGSIVEALLLWKLNIEKRFSGVEECTICYSIIHGVNYTTPKLRCKTCGHKFHSACLYKWLQTSGNSTCPLCRNLF